MAHDDDAPLAQLTKAPKFDDDTPLASLADPSKAAKSPASAKGRPPSRPSTGGGGPAAKSKGKGKGKPAKRKAESSSSSSSYSSSSDSDSEGGGGKKKKGQRGKLLKKKTEDGLTDGGGAVKNRDRSVKEQVVAQLLCRWWYALPDWPPDNEEYYKAKLKEQNLRKVSVEEWEWLPEEDEKGRKKVYELSQFRGMFRSSHGDLHDLRPKETCPCYSNFMKKELPDLYDLLIKAYEGQLVELKNSKYNETKMKAEIQVALTHVRDKANQARAVVGVKKPRLST